MTDYELFDKVLEKLNGMDGKSITLTKDNVAKGDDFLIFSYYDRFTITFKKRRDGVWVVVFDEDDKILLENCPTSFYHTLLKNL